MTIVQNALAWLARTKLGQKLIGLLFGGMENS